MSQKYVTYLACKIMSQNQSVQNHLSQQNISLNIIKGSIVSKSDRRIQANETIECLCQHYLRKSSADFKA